jgi:hypothetical protein
MIVQVTTAIAGALFNYPSTLYYWSVYFNITVDDWSPDSIKIIYLAGPLMAGIVGIVSMIIYSNLKEFTFHFKLFFLWSAIHALSMLFGALLIGTLFDTGIGHAIGWMYVTDTGKLLYSMFSLFVLVTSGFMLTRPVLFSANVFFSDITEHNRAFFLNAQLTLPYLLGVGLLILVRQPRFMFYETFITFTTVLIVLPILGSAGNHHDIFFEEEKKRFNPRWITIFISLAVLLAYRFVLEIGIPLFR